MNTAAAPADTIQFHNDTWPALPQVDWTAVYAYAQNILFLIALLLGCWLTLYCSIRWGAAAGVAGGIAGLGIAAAVLFPIQATAYVIAPMVILAGIFALLGGRGKDRLLGAVAVLIGIGAAVALHA